MIKNVKIILFGLFICVVTPLVSKAQFPEQLSDRYIRVAEVGELVDSVNVWGDVGSSGRYLVPVNTNLPDLISFAMGYNQRMGSGRGDDAKWAKTLIEVKVSRYNEEDKLVEVAFFRYRYRDAEPVEMFEFDLQNNDIVALQVRRTPTFTDYINIVAPVVSVLATSLLLIQNLKN